MNRILIIGAAGNVGRQVVSQLMATGAPEFTLKNDETFKIFAG